MIKVLNENTFYFNKIKESLDYTNKGKVLYIEGNQIHLEKNSIIIYDEDSLSVKFKEDEAGNTIAEVRLILKKLHIDEDWKIFEEFEYWFMGETPMVPEIDGTLPSRVLLKLEGVEGDADFFITVNLRSLTYSILIWKGKLSYE